MLDFIKLDRKKFTIKNFSELIDATNKIFHGQKADVARSLMLLAVGQACKSYLKSAPFNSNGVKPNFFRIFGNMYYVCTQSGFNNALYDCVGEDSGYSKSRIREMARSYPEQYPAIISLTDETFEAGRILVQWVPLVNLVGSDLPIMHDRKGCRCCWKPLAESKGCCISRGSLWIKYSAKTDVWSIECPETGDYSIISVCPMCGRNLHED